MLARGGRLLASMEPFAGELVADGLRASGVDLRLSTGLDAVARRLSLLRRCRIPC